ncbi:MAG TPA: ferrochelatase [Candidatus Saccharimonadales bacterium]|jgi:ferrochelatase
MANSAPAKTGVIIMTYGSATTAEHVAEYMHHIYKDKVPEGLIDDFADRYRQVGHSPLVEITEKQAVLLGNELGGDFIVKAGMLHSHPFIEEAVAACREAGAEKLVGIILSPQFSSFIMEGYRTKLKEAAQKHSYTPDDVVIAGPWPTEPNFVGLLSKRVNDALTRLHKTYGDNVPVVFTTHSLPERVVAKDPEYLTQLQATAEAVVARLDDPKLEWYRGYQSAGHTPEPWLKPDLVDILADLRDKHDKAVLIVPIQFLADHLEILYDLDIAGGEQCEDYGISYNRIELPNTDPLFIASLAAVTSAALHPSK